MIKVGKLTDYAIALMGQLSIEGDTASRSAHFLAVKTAIPEPTVAKVLKILTREKMVESARGALGGYKLTHLPHHISLVDIITAMEGPISIVTCVEGNDNSCKNHDNCPVKGNWDKVNTAIKTTLETIKLSDMTGTSCGMTYDFIGTPVNAVTG
jgi:FeS assembly SUF system regulator